MSSWKARATGVGGLALAALAATPAAGQSSACVHLLAGAAYAAQIRVVTGGLHSDWSTPFGIGSTACQSLAAVADGQPFSIELRPLEGTPRPCAPANVKRSAAANLPVSFLAWGAPAEAHCGLPEEGHAEQHAAARQVNKEGEAAARALRAAATAPRPSASPAPASPNPPGSGPEHQP